MSDSKRHLFLGSCLSAMLRQYTIKSPPSEPMIPKIELLREFIMDLLASLTMSKDDDTNESRGSRTMFASFLFKLLLWSYSKIKTEGMLVSSADTPGDARMPKCVKLQCSDEALLPALVA